MCRNGNVTDIFYNLSFYIGRTYNKPKICLKLISLFTQPKKRWLSILALP